MNNKKLYNEKQVEEIKLGLSRNVDVSIYASPKFNAQQMLQIRWGLEDGVDVSIYAKPEFNFEQMWEMRLLAKK